MSSVTARRPLETACTRAAIPMIINGMPRTRSLGARVIQGMYFTRKVYWT